jgi:hypothetical protein
MGMTAADSNAIHRLRRVADNAIGRYAVLAAGGIACALLVLPALPFLASDRGVPGPAVLDAVHPVKAGVALSLAAGACTAVACAVGRVINAAVGMFVLGIGLAVVAGRSGTVLDAAFDADSLRPMAVETLAWAVAAAALSAIVFRASGPLLDFPARDRKGPFLREVVNPDALRSLLAGLATAAVLWFCLASFTKGQAIGCAFAGGVIAAFIGRRILGDSQPILLMAAPVLAVGAAQLWTSFTFRAPLDQALAARALPGWSMAMPIDVVAGTFLGVPFGLGWSKPAGQDD